MHYLLSLFSLFLLQKRKQIIQKFLAMLLLVMMLFITGLKALHHHHPEIHQLKQSEDHSHLQFRENHSYCPICDFNFSTLGNAEDDRLESFCTPHSDGCFGGGPYKASACLGACGNNLRLRGPPSHH